MNGTKAKHIQKIHPGLNTTVYHGTSFFITKNVEEYVEKLQCPVCMREILREHAHTCPLCGQSHCFEHQEPEAHNCVKLGTRDWEVYRYERDSWRKKTPRVSMGDRKPVDYEQVRASHEIRHSKPGKRDWGLINFVIMAIVALLVLYLLMRGGII